MNTNEQVVYYDGIKEILVGDVVKLKIREIMHEEGINEADLCDMCDASSSTVRQCLDNKNYTVKTLAMIAVALKKEIRELFCDSHWSEDVSSNSFVYCPVGGQFGTGSKSDIAAVMSVLRCSEQDAVDVLMSNKSVTPTEYYLIAYELKERAHLYIKDIIVK